jgi:hypothetical protein
MKGTQPERSTSDIKADLIQAISNNFFIFKDDQNSSGGYYAGI